MTTAVVSEDEETEAKGASEDAEERSAGDAAEAAAEEDAAVEAAAVEDAAVEAAAVEDAAVEAAAVEDAAVEDVAAQVTTVDVRCTGHVRGEVGAAALEYAFAGETLRDFLEAFFADHDVRDMLIAETEAEATTAGWAPEDVGLPGNNYAKNPEGEQTRSYARVTVNGVFNEHLDGLDTVLEEGDRVALMYPFIYCC